MKNNKKMSNGITLIALVVTIIVLLILAGISIQMLTGNNGILQRATEAKEKTEESQIIEDAKMNIINFQANKLTGNITERELNSILSQYGTLSTEEENIKDKTLTTNAKNYKIPISKIYNGIISEATIENTDQKMYYGDSIDYDVDIGVSLDDTDQYDWKIFYNDGTNIYIIAEDHVSMSKCTGVTNSLTGRKEDNSKPYSLYWDRNGGIIPTPDNIKGSINIFTSSSPKTSKLADEYLTVWKPYVTGTNSASENSNAKMVEVLMDTNLWNNFATSIKVSELTDEADDFMAIGGPTLEMWVKSWNIVYGSELRLYYTSNASGYFIGTSENPSTLYVKLSKTRGYTDTLYYPHTSDDYIGCYRLASPSAFDRSCGFALTYNGLLTNSPYYGNDSTVRPVVCLPSDITATWNEADGVWNIIKK